MWDLLYKYWEVPAFLVAVLGPVLTICTILWVLASRKEATSTVAWCLVIIALPLLGPRDFTFSAINMFRGPSRANSGINAGSIPPRPIHGSIGPRP